MEVVSIAREAGDRSKIAVMSRDENVDPVGTCVGPKGTRVQAIVNELNGENMDIVEWDEDPAIFIKNALNPAQVLEVMFDKENKSCVIVVPDYQLSLAIGKRGQNVRLAAKLTGFKIDIKSESDMGNLEEKADDLTNDSFFEALNNGEEVAEQEVDSLGNSDKSFFDTENEVADIDEIQVSDAANTNSDVYAEEIATNTDQQPLDPLNDGDFEKGELNPEDMEELIQSAEKRDGMDEEVDTKASIDEMKEISEEIDEENS